MGWVIIMAREYKFHYTICNAPDKELYARQCAALEKYIPSLMKGKELEDVDGSLSRLYYNSGKELMVSNDYYIGALYIDSEFDIEPYFA